MSGDFKYRSDILVLSPTIIMYVSAHLYSAAFPEPAFEMISTYTCITD